MKALNEESSAEARAVSTAGEGLPGRDWQQQKCDPLYGLLERYACVFALSVHVFSENILYFWQVK